jgi:hypothetical protein
MLDRQSRRQVLTGWLIPPKKVIQEEITVRCISNNIDTYCV